MNDPLTESRIARTMYRAGYLAGWEERDWGRSTLHPDLTDEQVDIMLAALRLVDAVPRPDYTTDVEYRL